MSAYAVGRKAIGICDRCGFEYPLHELRKETINQFQVNLKVCPQCWDPDQPQTLLGKFPITDAQALRDPRPDTGAAESRSLSGFDPVRGMELRGSIGIAHGAVS